MTSLANEVLPGRMCRIRSSHSIGDIRPSQDSNAFATPADSKGKYTHTGADIVGSLRSSKEQRDAIILCEIFGPSRGMQSLDRNMGLQAVCPASFQPAASCYDPEKGKMPVLPQRQNAYVPERAGVAELADALDSKSSDRKIVWARAPPPALAPSGAAFARIALCIVRVANRDGTLCARTWMR